MASAPSARRTGKGSMCNQQFRRIDAMCSALHKAVMTELAAETLQKRVETKRVEIENKRRAAAITLSAATPMPGEETARPARENFADGRSNGDEDGSDAPESSAVGSGAAALKPPCACSSRPSGSAGSGTAGVVSRSGVLEDEVGTAHRCGNGSGKVDKAMGVGVEVGSSPTGGETHGCDTSSDHGGGSTVQAAAAAVVTGNGAGGPLSASAGASRGVAKASKKHNIVFLEDLLRMTTNPKGSLRSNAIVMPKTKRKSHGPRDTGDGRSNEKTSRKKPRKVAGAASGPFSGLSLCVVHLGSVTKNTIKTFARGVRDGGGRLSTYYTAGDTTHIVVDASLGATWDKLGDYFSGWDDFEDLGGGGRSRVPDAVPVVSREWMSECLRRSSVVALDAYRLTPPPPQSEATPTAAETKGRQQQQQQQGTGTAVSIPDAAWNDLTYSAAAAAATGKMRPAARGEKINDLAAPRERNQGGDVVEPATDGAAAKSSESMVEGGFGARNPDVGAKRHKFHCQMTGSGVHRVFNKEAADMLERLAELCAARGGDGSVFRERGFKNAAGALKRLGVQITDVQQLKDLRKSDPDRVRGIGDSVMRELETFYEEGKMHRLDGMEADPKLKCLELFNKISWVGEVTAQKLYSEGMRSIEDVRERGQHLLNEQARICLSRHEDISQRMPRAEAAEIEAMVTEVAQSISPGVICQACGSYRRGKSYCGDVDVLIRPPEGEEDSPIFHELIRKLTESGFVTDHLAVPKRQYEPGTSQTFMGICKLPGDGRLHRRLDIKLYPTSMFAFAVLYFTGSGHFNMSMRSFAKIKGLKLSDKGLCRVNSVDGKEVHKFPSYRSLQEEDVFTALGLEWREPKDREGVQVEAYASCGAEGAVELSGRVVPVTPAQQEQYDGLQEQWLPTVEEGDCLPENGEQHQEELTRQMGQQAELFFLEQEQLQQAIHLSRGYSRACGGSGASPPPTAAVTGEANIEGGAGDEDKMIQEALRRSVADTGAAAGGPVRSPGGEEELWEKLPPEVLADDSKGGGAASEGGGDVGAGSEHSPVCL